MTVSTLEREQLKAARDKGVAYLDRDWPGWRERVNGRSLDMGHIGFCVLAQGTGTCDFDDALYVSIGETNEWGEEHGFYVNNLDPNYYKPRYEALTELWKEIL